MRGQGRWWVTYSPFSAVSRTMHKYLLLAGRWSVLTRVAVLWLHPEPGISLDSWLEQAQGEHLSRRPSAVPESASTYSGAGFE